MDAGALMLLKLRKSNGRGPERKKPLVGVEGTPKNS